MSSRGRPRRFDRELALQQALALYWARGYEGVTVSDLQLAMGGISAPSFYAAFHSKEALFREIVELHRQTEGRDAVEALDGGPTARDSICAMLKRAAEGCSQPGKPSGCLMMVSATNSAEANRGITEFVSRLRQERLGLIRNRLDRGVREGDLSSGANPSVMSLFYVAVLDGIASQARDGVSRADLLAVGASAMAAWETLAAGTGVAPSSAVGD